MSGFVKNVRKTFAIMGGLASVAASPALADHVHLNPVRASDALASFGLNTHINYQDSAYAQFGRVKDALQYVGITHLRELAPMPWFSGAAPIGYYSELMRQGYDIDFVVPGGKVDLQKSFAPIFDLSKDSTTRISAIEGFNEVDHAPVTFDGLSGNDAAIKGQKAIYALVHGDSRLKNVSVIDVTGVSAEPTVLDGRADLGNAHIYPQNGFPPDGWFRGMQGLAQKVHVPMAVTEFGYASLPQSGWLVIGVDETGQAKGVLAGLLSGLETGFSRTYVYELLDERPDSAVPDRESHFGLFDNQFRKKPAAIAIHNVTQLLRDSDATVDRKPVQPLDLDVSGLPKTGHIVAIEKADGSIWLAVWNEAPFWDNQRGAPVADQPVSVTISPPKLTKSSAIYAPLNVEPLVKRVDGGGPVTFDVSNAPVLVEFQPR